MTKSPKTAVYRENIEVYLPRFLDQFDCAAGNIERKLDDLAADQSRTFLQVLPIRLIGTALVGISAALCVLPIVIAISAI